MNVLLRAINTSAVTMTWAVAELIRTPRAMKKVQSEIRNTMRDKSVITLDDIDYLHYLKMVIKETWRLHPPAPLLIPREVLSEFEINGYAIQPKALLHVNVWAIRRDPDTWKEPEMFLPERFMDKNIDAKDKISSCYRLEVDGEFVLECTWEQQWWSFVLRVYRLYHFDLKLPEGMVVEDIDMEESPGLVVSKENELLLVPVKYLDH